VNALQTFIAKLPFGFITPAQLPELIALDRLHPCLIRCGGCRVTTAAQDVEHVIRCISAGGDYVRDVSLPVGSMERAAKWQPDCPVTAATMLPQSFLADRPAKQRKESWSLNRGSREYDDTISETNIGL
jgi:hypothetical protein